MSLRDERGYGSVSSLYLEQELGHPRLALQRRLLSERLSLARRWLRRKVVHVLGEQAVLYISLSITGRGRLFPLLG